MLKSDLSVGPSLDIKNYGTEQQSDMKLSVKVTSRSEDIIIKSAIQIILASLYHSIKSNNKLTS